MKSGIGVRKPVQTTVYALAGGAITTAAWVQILAKALNKYACSVVEIFNPTGSSLLIATGEPGSEVALPYTILPGGTTGWLAFEIPIGVSISLKAQDVTTGTPAANIILNQLA